MRRTLALPAPALASLALTACVPNASEDATTITVTADADGCTLSAVEAPAGPVTFSVTNEGDAETELYVLGADGASVVTELEHIGPGLPRAVTVTLESGDYFTSCRTSDDEEHEAAPFTVTEA